MLLFILHKHQTGRSSRNSWGRHDNENSKKAKQQLCTCITRDVHHPFLNISLPSLHQWCLTLTPDSTETIERMTGHCFLRPIRRDLTSSSHTTASCGGRATRQRLPCFSEIRYCPLGTNSRNICQHLTKGTRRKKREVALKVMFSQPSSSSTSTFIKLIKSCKTFEGKNEQLFFELSPRLKYLFCSVGPTRHLRTPVWVGRCWYRPFHVLSWGSSRDFSWSTPRIDSPCLR